MKHRILKAEDKYQHAAALAAINAHIERYGDAQAGKHITYSIMAGGRVHQVEVSNGKKFTTAEVRVGHRKLFRAFG